MKISFFKNLFFGLFILLSLSWTACVRDENIQDKGADFLQGVWSEAAPAYKESLNNYTLHDFKFSCDSFYVDLSTHSKVNYYADSCFNQGVWKEYAKGQYVVVGDTLFVLGTFTKANYKQKIGGCYREGEYRERFLITRKNADTVFMESLADQHEVNLVLKESLTCIPKKL